MVNALLAGVLSAVAAAVATAVAGYFIPIVGSCLKWCFFKIFPCCGSDENEMNPDAISEGEANPDHPSSGDKTNPGPTSPDPSLPGPTNPGPSSPSININLNSGGNTSIDNLKIFYISARNLEIEHSENKEYWKWVEYPSGSRFTEVAELLEVWFFHIKTSINFLELSANTKYGAYLIFKRTEDSEGLHVIMNTLVSVVGRKPETKSVCLKPTSATPANIGKPEPRSDGWLELELGKFDCDIVTNKDAVIIIKETNRMDIRKTGLTVAGIEIRPI